MLFFNKNTRPGTKEEIWSLLGAQVMTDYEKYLGLSMVCGKLKVSTFKGIQERVSKRVLGWMESYISKAGREVLIKYIAQVTKYFMSIFKIPKNLCNDINSI